LNAEYRVENYLLKDDCRGYPLFNPESLRLANTFPALYHKEIEEKRLLDAILLAVPR